MKKLLVFSLLLTLLFQGVSAQLTITITSFPANTPVGDTLYLAGTFNTWNPADATYRFTKNQSTYSITLPKSVTGAIEFKVTRGDWDREESTAAGADISNRAYNTSAGNALSIQIAGWKDLLGGGTSTNHTATFNVHILSNTFYIPQLKTTRRIWIYLPPGYDSTDNRYPVFYMHDGQNLFDNATSFSGEWHVDESLNNLFAMGDKGSIVVGIDNGGTERLNEYSPWVNPDYGGGKGDKYMDFIVNTLKPHIDSTYRTEADRQHTGIFGSSMGGLISLYGAIKFQQVFGMAGVFSPSLWFSDSLYTYVAAEGKKANMRIYFDAGQNESSTTVSDLNRMVTLLTTLGFDTSEVKEVIRIDGQHNEAFWGREFPAAYLWLTRSSLTGIVSVNKSPAGFAIMPNPATDVMTALFSLPVAQQVNIVVYDISGKVVDTLLNKQMTAGKYALQLNSSKLRAGMYFVSLQYGSTHYTQMIEVVK